MFSLQKIGKFGMPHFHEQPGYFTSTASEAKEREREPEKELGVCKFGLKSSGEKYYLFK